MQFEAQIQLQTMSRINCELPEGESGGGKKMQRTNKQSHSNRIATKLHEKEKNWTLRGH